MSGRTQKALRKLLLQQESTRSSIEPDHTDQGLLTNTHLRSPDLTRAPNEEKGKDGSKSFLDHAGKAIFDPDYVLPIRKLAIVLAIIAIGAIMFQDNAGGKLDDLGGLWKAARKWLLFLIAMVTVFVMHRAITPLERWWAYKAPLRAKYGPALRLMLEFAGVVVIIFLLWRVNWQSPSP